MLSNRRLVAACSIALCCNFTLLAIFVKYNVGERCYVNIDENQKALAVIPDDFLGIGIDSFENYDNVDFASPRVRELIAVLGPARIRLGDTMSERLVYSLEDIPSVSCKHCPVSNTTKSACSAIKKLCKHKLPHFVMPDDKWMEVTKLCKDVGMKLLFNTNFLICDGNKWSSENASELLEYSRHRGYEVDWHLDNEPNSFHHDVNITITPQMLLHDLQKLQHLFNHYGYKKSPLAGREKTHPETKCPHYLEFMVEFLANGSKVFNIRSWHQYYLKSRSAKLEDLWSPETFDSLEKEIETMKNLTAQHNYISMWLAESGSPNMDGSPALSKSYASSPLWLHKLGMAAKHNITTVIRQNIFSGNNTLFDGHMEPLPDWWISVLFKKLVGNKVLAVECKCSSFQRMYAHCANRHYTNDTTAITLFAVNLELEKARFLLNGTAIHGANLNIDEYILSVPSNNRNSKTLWLNGWPLYYESSLPDLQPQHHRYGNHISLPPYSIGFWVLKNTSIKICE